MVGINLIRALVATIALTSIGIVWYKIVVTPNLPMPIFQGLSFTAIMVVFAWVAVGCPKGKGKK